MNLIDISLVCFDEETRAKYEFAVLDEETGVSVQPILSKPRGNPMP